MENKKKNLKHILEYDTFDINEDYKSDKQKKLDSLNKAVEKAAQENTKEKPKKDDKSNPESSESDSEIKHKIDQLLKKFDKDARNSDSTKIGDEQIEREKEIRKLFKGLKSEYDKKKYQEKLKDDYDFNVKLDDKEDKK